MENKFDGSRISPAGKIENGQPVFAFYDIKAKFYDKFFVLKSVGQALRILEDLANDPKTSIGQHPEDFILYQIGYWDDWSGKLSDIVKVEIGQAIQYVKKGVNNALSNETLVRTDTGCENTKVGIQS